MLAGDDDMIDLVIVSSCIFMESESSEVQADGIIEKVRRKNHHYAMSLRAICIFVDDFRISVLLCIIYCSRNFRRIDEKQSYGNHGK